MSDPYQSGYAFAYGNGERSRQNALSAAAGGMLARGDMTGARNMLYRGGELEAGQNIANAQATSEDAARKRRAEAALWASKGIRSAVAAGHNPTEAFETAIKLAPAAGYDLSDLQQLRPVFEQDPKGFLDQFDHHAQEALKVYQSGGHIVGLDTDTGEKRWGYDMPQEAKPPGPLIRDESGNWIPNEAYIKAMGAVAEGRAAATARHRAPPRGRSGGGGGPSLTGLPPGYVPR